MIVPFLLLAILLALLFGPAALVLIVPLAVVFLVLALVRNAPRDTGRMVTGMAPGLANAIDAGTVAGPI
jgi:hypothetical protein